MRIKSHIIFSFFVLIFVSCSGLPNSNKGEEVLSDIIEKQSKNIISISKFKKTNGMEREFMGNKMYLMQILCSIKFEEDSYKSCSPFSGCFNNFITYKVAPNNGNLFESVKPFKKGDIVNLKGELVFVKKENGWEFIKANF